MSQEEKVFAEGFIFKRRDNAPDFVIGNISIKVDEAIAFLRKHEKNGWVNLNAKTARSGNPYLELDTWEAKGNGEHVEKKGKMSPAPAPNSDGEDDDLPF
jgi:hypothetical protein